MVLGCRGGVGSFVFGCRGGFVFGCCSGFVLCCRGGFVFGCRGGAVFCDDAMVTVVTATVRQQCNNNDVMVAVRQLKLDNI